MSTASITPVTFSREEIAAIREMLRTWEKPPVCPRCGGELVIEEPELEELKGRAYLKCKPCNRSAFASITP